MIKQISLLKNRRLRKENEQLKMEKEILKLFFGLTCKGDRREMIYRFIDTKRPNFLVKALCKVCKVSQSSYYYWDSMGRSSNECATEATEELKKTVYKAYVATRSLYGAPRLTKELSIYGVMISKSRTARIMASMGIHGACGRVMSLYY